MSSDERRLRKLAHVSYPSYLRTEHWRRVRVKTLTHQGHRCASCGTGGPLDVHHDTYQRVGRERPDDVRALCRPCHSSLHPDKRPPTYVLLPHDFMALDLAEGAEDAGDHAERSAQDWWEAHVEEWADNLYGASEPDALHDQKPPEPY